MNATIFSHAIYTIISVTLTVWVGRALFKNGQIFLNDAFYGNKEMAVAVNHLLIVGFYLLNMGFIALFLRFGPQATNGTEIFEFTSTKLGVVLLALGGIHYFNMFNIAKMRRKARQSNREEKQSAPPTPAAPPASTTRPLMDMV